MVSLDWYAVRSGCMQSRLGHQAISTPVTPLHLTFTPVTGLQLTRNSPVLSQLGETGNYRVSEVKLHPNLTFQQM